MTSRALTIAILASLAMTVAADKAAIDQILDEESVADDHVETRRCIRSDGIDRIDVLSGSHIVFQTSRTERWLVQLSMRCPGLSPSSKIALEQNQFRLCEFDTVRVVYDNPIGGVDLGPRCQLGKFEAVSAEQVAALREELAARNRSGRIAPP